MPIGFCTSMCTAKKITLFSNAFQNCFDQPASVISVTKLARPTKCLAPELSPVNVESFIVAISG